MTVVKAEYLVAQDSESGEEQNVKFIPPEPSDGDLGGISKEDSEQITKNKNDIDDIRTTLWDKILDKLTSAVVERLNTNNKTVIGALNELNSNAFLPKKELRMSADDVEQGAYRVDESFPIDSEQNAVLLCFKIYENNPKLIVQFLIPYNCNYIKIRTHWYTSWFDWKTYNPL